jgi:hypothetical protein
MVGEGCGEAAKPFMRKDCVILRSASRVAFLGGTPRALCMP